MDWSSGELLGFDLETTGPDPLLALPVSFALITFEERHVVRRVAALVDPGVPIPAAATAVHGVTTTRAQAEGHGLAGTVLDLLEVVVDAGARGVPLVGMNLAYDLTILERLGSELTGAGLRARGWRGPALDVLVIDRRVDPHRKGKRRLGELCATYGVALENAHDAGSDAEAAVEVLFRICASSPALLERGLSELFADQAVWHHDWATSYDTWRAAQGMERLDTASFAWPIAP